MVEQEQEQEQEQEHYLRVECAAVSRLVDPEDPLDPGDHLVAAGVGRLIQADEAGLDVFLDVSLQRRGAVREGRVVVCPDIKLVEVLEKERPLGGIQLGGGLLRGGHGEAAVLLQGRVR